MPAFSASQAAVIAAMRQPAFYGTLDRVEHRETHISHVFLVGDHAYKLKKELQLAFLDYGTLERRRFFCQEEIRLNGPLAPSVYRAVRAVVPASSGFALADESDPRAVEYVVEMRRYSEDDTLDALVRSGKADRGLVRRLAAVIADLHARAAPVPTPDLPTRIASDLNQLEVAAGSDAKPLPVVASAARAFAVRTAPELEARARRGLVREGHGDLRLEHVLVGGRIELVDCVEFDPALRRADVAYDLAFTIMELHERGAPALADALADGYRDAGGDPGDAALLHGLAGCRAIVRAKVAAVRSPPRPGELGHFLRVARVLLWLGRCPLTVVVCGPSATGKTTLSAELARASSLPHFSSDVVRKALAGIAATARLDPDGYSAAASFATYNELGRLAREQAERGSGAIIDATFRRAGDRKAFEDTFRSAAGGFVVLRLSVPAAVARHRAASRARDPGHVSDAGPEIAEAQACEFEPLSGRWLASAASLEADGRVEELAGLAEKEIDALLARRMDA